jgi:hypothetical protein
LQALFLIVVKVESSHQVFIAVYAFVKAGVERERALVLQEVPLQRFRSASNVGEAVVFNYMKQIGLFSFSRLSPKKKKKRVRKFSVDLSIQF